MKGVTNKKVFLILAACFFLLFTPFVCAHSGGTDENGGHTDSSTGEYHYHHGYEAHQHEDIDGDGVPDCPYDFVNNEDHTPRSSSTKDTTDESSYSSYILGGFCILLIAGFLCYVAYVGWNHFLDHRQWVQETQERARIREETRNRYTSMYGGKPIEALVDIPENAKMGTDGLPRNKGESSPHLKWGIDYTFFVAGSRHQVYHTSECCYAVFPVNAYNLRSSRPCSFCKPVLPELSWVAEYNRIKHIKDEYDIE